jgi:membrane-associated PAP2 superfamily phosphatase
VNRNGLWIAVAIGAVAGIVFGIRPDLDLAISALFFDPVRKLFALHRTAPVHFIDDVAVWILVLLVAPALIAWLLKAVWPRSPVPASGRAALFLVATLALAPGLLVNGILKAHWPRPRPIEVVEFGGSHRFVAWWDPRGTCERNCSFVSGESASAFWSLAPAALTPPAWRALAYGAALVYGAAVSGLRIAAGAHFFTDAVFAAVLTFLVVWLAYRVIYRPPAP